ncbi:hypothetical protein RRF57_011680 [Xylaria bambusicola]|uniref:Uncharacterized protein n=1 Tax=Xylaria bambusicola TaxID=326684 RepID=A0AAN7UVA8_9PEZI
MHTTHPYQPDMSRRNEFTGYPTPGQNPAAQQHQQHSQQHHQQQAQHGQHQSHQPHQTHQSHAQHGSHAQHQQQHTQHQSQPQHHQQHHATPVPPPINLSTSTATPTPQQSTPTQTPAQPAARGRKRPAPGHQQTTQQSHQAGHTQPHASTPTPASAAAAAPATTASAPMPSTPATAATPVPAPSVAQQTPVPAPTPGSDAAETPSQAPPVKKSRTNTPWTPAEELRLKQMRDAGNSWAEIAKTFPTRTEGSVKKHWYKDMHYAEFAEDESQALLNAIKDYENNKWKTIGQKVGKPAKACEQYAKEHFPDHFASQKALGNMRIERYPF